MKAPTQIDAMRLVLAEARCRKSTTSGEGLATSGGRSDEKRIQRDVVTALRLDTHAERIGDLAAGCGHDVYFVELFTEDEICHLECGQGRKAQIREPWRQQKTHGCDVGLPFAGCLPEVRLLGTES
jgi:hypothetical protein